MYAELIAPALPRLTGAVFDNSRKYRYILYRAWERGDYCAFIGLNPSTADETDDDPTVRRCVGFAKRWGYAGLIMLNIFAVRSTDPKGIRESEPIGEGNDLAILGACLKSTRVVCAWGNHGLHLMRGSKVHEMLHNGPNPLYHLGLTKLGQPKHPLYLKGDLEPQLWT